MVNKCLYLNKFGLLENDNIVDEKINEENKIRGDNTWSFFSGALLLGGVKHPAYDS